MRTLFTAAALLAAAGAANAQFMFEISEDGRDVAFPVAQQTQGQAARGSTLPFGTTPDIEVALRRQIGGLAVADMNGDGLKDVVAVCYSSSSFPPYDDWREMVFYNTPSGLSTTPGWYSDNQTHAGDVQVGDVNGDGFPDIVAIRGGSVRTDNVQIYFGTASGPSTSPGYSSSYSRRAWGTSGDLFDIDNDGDLDLMTTNQGLSPDPYRPMLLYRNNGSGLGVTPDWQSGSDEISNGLAHADLLGSDGLPEVIAAKWVNFNSGVYQNTAGTPDPFPFMSVAATTADKGAAAGDINGDGFPDVVIGGDPVMAYDAVHGALIPFWTANPPFGGSQEVRLHDADGDGDLDVADVVFGDGRAHLYQNNSGTLDTTPTWTFDAPEVGTAITFGDLNGDGRDDLVVGYSGDICIRVFLAQAPPCLADLTGDGVLDLADVQAFITAFVAGDSAADLAAPFGVLDLADVQAFIASFIAGCP
ncbi:MAG: VCBS repeat-containing protein [Phycisphaeraceae bacterium]|nr:MAG: VCBS repeat-containing protein [Phycisphaeraceae bacterium]